MLLADIGVLATLGEYSFRFCVPLTFGGVDSVPATGEFVVPTEPDAFRGWV